MSELYLFELKLNSRLLSIVFKNGEKSYLNAAEDQCLESAFKVVDAELDGRLARVDGDFELGSMLNIADADDVPRRLGRFPGPESADERKLLRQSLRENVPKIAFNNNSNNCNYQLISCRIRLDRGCTSWERLNRLLFPNDRQSVAD